MIIKAVVVDDEILARKRIMTLLENHDDVKVIGQCRNGTEAVETIRQKEPDLVFLDIQMPDIDGFEVISKLKMSSLPHFIFATAFDHFALKAFEVHALDYLLKPFDGERFEEALQLAKEQIQLRQESVFNQKLVQMIKSHQRNDDSYLSSFVIKDRGREFDIECEDIFYLEANGNYVVLRTDKVKHLYRSTMNTLEEQLNPEDFIRVHRSFILNKRYIKGCRYMNNNEYKFSIKNGANVLSGRAYKEAIIEYLKESQ
ncbi:MAG: LytTR family DNA-binding domain-containing protein [Bacteroidota bacterium]